MLASRMAPWKGRTLRFGLGAATAAVAALVGVARNKWIALHLGAEGVGVLGQVMAAQSWLGVAASLGLTVAVTRRLGAALGAGDTEAARRTAWTALALAGVAGALASVVTRAAAPQLATVLLGDARYAPLLRIIAAGIAGLAIQSVIQGIFAGRSDVRAGFTLGLGGGLAVVAATMLLVPGRDVAGAAIAVVLMFPVGIAVALLAHRREYAPLLRPAPRPLLDRGVARGLLGIGAAALTLAFIDQGTLLLMRAHYLREHGIAANGLLQAAVAISQQVAAPFCIYFAGYAIGRASAAADAWAIESYTRRLWTPILLLAALACAAGMVGSGPLLSLLYADTFTAARPLMAWSLAGEFVRIAAQTWIIGALPLAGARRWLVIGLITDATLATAYVVLDNVGAGMLSLPLAYGASGVATLAAGIAFMARVGVRPRARDMALVAGGGLALAALAARIAR
jgi:O-antigen/teichoic acid export membrane protein